MRKKNTNIWCVIPAAGSGSRFGGEIPKQYLPVAGVPVIYRTISRLLDVADVEGVIVGISPEDSQWDTDQFRNRNVFTTEGGESRAHTVLNGLRFLQGKQGLRGEIWALVHDAVRPCVPCSDVTRLIETCIRENAGGILCAEVVDTLKAVNAAGEVESTEDRTRFRRALTPQLFKLDDLVAALESAIGNNCIPTDESMAMELAGYSPLTVPGSGDNIKITRPIDLIIAEKILGK